MRIYTNGKNHPSWRGGRFATSNGYVKVHVPLDHELRPKDGSNVFEHILVVWEHLNGEIDLTGKVVHHRNEKRDDNRIENLVVFKTRGMHANYHKLLKTFRWSEARAMAHVGYENVTIFDPELEDAVRRWSWVIEQERAEGLKHCRRCHLPYPLDEFHNNPGTSDGKQAYCKPCARIKQLENRKKALATAS